MSSPLRYSGSFITKVGSEYECLSKRILDDVVVSDDDDDGSRSKNEDDDDGGVTSYLSVGGVYS